MTSHTITYRLFGFGKMPESVRQEIAGETVLFEAEGIPVAIRQRGRVPGAIKKRGLTRLSGSFAITDRRVIGAGRNGKLADVPFDFDGEGPATIRLAGDGVHVHFDLDRVDPSLRGEMLIDFKGEIPGDVLAQVPWTERSFPVNARAVVRTFKAGQRPA